MVGEAIFAFGNHDRRLIRQRVAGANVGNERQLRKGPQLTVEAFCKDEGLSRSSFSRWRSRLPMQAGSAATTMHESDAHKAAPSFVDLGLLGAASTATPASLEVRLDLGGGLSLTLVRR